MRAYTRAYAYNAKRTREQAEFDAMIDQAVKDKASITAHRKAYTDLRLAKIIGKGAYGVRKFGRDFKSIVPRSMREEGMAQMMAAMHGSGAYSGRGDYTSNGLVDGGRPSMTFSSDNDETQSLVIHHTEYMQDVFGAPSAAFTCEGWNLNPALLDNFPWLAQMAANYEEYEFEQLLFSYKSTVDANATNNNNGATGTIIMATNYNPSAANFPNKEIMMQYHGANSGRVVDDHVHGVECDPEKNAGTGQKYTRTTPAVVGQDIKTFDLGKFQLAQVNIPSAFFNQQIGELWVTYTVKLDKPRLFSALGGLIAENRIVTNSSTAWTPGFNGSILGPLPAAGENTANWNQALGVYTITSGTVPVVDPAKVADFITSPTNLNMQQNSIGAAVGTCYNVQSASNAPGSAILITFPDFATGVFEVQLVLEGNLSTFFSCGVVYYGQVAAYNDMVGTAQSTTNPSNFYYANSSTQTLITVRVAVSPIVAGVDNMLQIACKHAVVNTVPTGTLTCGTLVIRQCSGFLGTSQINPLPVYVNAQGVITVPPAY